jgi:hypothetical protein
MLRLLRATAPVLLLGLSACGTLTPFGTAPADTPGVTAPTVAICYNRLGATPKEVEAAAAPDCGPKTQPRFVEQEWNLSACPMLTPIRATFACEPASTQQEPPQGQPQQNR